MDEKSFLKIVSFFLNHILAGYRNKGLTTDMVETLFIKTFRQITEQENHFKRGFFEDNNFTFLVTLEDNQLIIFLFDEEKDTFLKLEIIQEGQSVLWVFKDKELQDLRVKITLQKGQWFFEICGDEEMHKRAFQLVAGHFIADKFIEAYGLKGHVFAPLLKFMLEDSRFDASDPKVYRMTINHLVNSNPPIN